MKTFIFVSATSEHYCGFDTNGMIEISNGASFTEKDKDEVLSIVEEFMFDYINGSVDSSDEEEYENPTSTLINFTEVSEEEIANGDYIEPHLYGHSNEISENVVLYFEC